MMIDAPVQFYLKHARQIEEWNQLSKRANKVANEFFETVAEELRDRAHDLEHGAALVWIEEGWPKILLSRRDWCEAEPQDVKSYREILVGVGLEWKRAGVQLVDTGQTSLPYAGVWFNRDHARFKAVEAGIRDAVGIPDGTRRGMWWPFYGDQSYAGPEVWDHLDEYRTQLVERVVQLWGACASAIDDVLVRTTTDAGVVSE